MTMWAKLDEIQQLYLKAIFALDQAKKQEHDEYWSVSHAYDNRPASEWQQISYEEVLQEVRPKGEDGEQILAVLVREGLIERGQHQGLAPDHPRIRITRHGRKMVREALGIKREPFTEAQRHLITRIVSAGLAPQAEVEAAFWDRKGGSPRIEAWRQILKERASAVFAEEQRQYQKHLASLTRWEPCAYPGCPVKIKVRTLSIGGKVDGNKEEPKPVRFMELIEQLPGWHEKWLSGIKVRVPNTRTTLLHLYACSPTHKEGVYRLGGKIILNLDQAEEQRLQSTVYPWTSEEARRAIRLEGASDALDYVAQAPLGTTFPSSKAWARINTIGQSCLSAFRVRTMSEPSNAGKKQFTDDEAALTKQYLEMFRLEFKSGLNIREAILAPKPRSFRASYRDDPRWQQLYDLMENSKV